MKKILLVLAASAFVMSCKNLADNEYEITGTVDPSLNGKSLFLEKQGGLQGFTAVDTVKIEDGKFIFKGTVKEPEFHFISIEGQPMNKFDLVLEHGSIDIELDKDTLAKSKRSGTYNNEMLSKYVEIPKKFREEEKVFVKKNTPLFQKAMEAKDQAAMDKLNNEYRTLKERISKEKTAKELEFIKENPKAYLNIFLIGQIAKTPEEGKKLFESLDPELKKTEKGKELAKAFTDKPEVPAAPAEAPGKNNAEVGSTAPAFSANTPAGKKLSLKEAMGKVTIIDFWASWCPPCRKENPNVVALYNEYHATGLNIIGVSLDKPGQDANWKKAIADDKLNWNHVSNLMHWDEPIAKLYGVESIPATFVLDASGKIVARDLRDEELKAKVAELLAK
jgi:peroxiredoxin